MKIKLKEINQKTAKNIAAENICRSTNSAK